MGFRKEYKIYGDLLFEHKPTIRSLILHILYNKFINKERAKLSVYRENAQFVDPNRDIEGLEIKHIALVKNGNVVELIRLQKQTADILLSKNTKLIEYNPQESVVKKNMKYKDGKFSEETTDEKN